MPWGTCCGHQPRACIVGQRQLEQNRITPERADTSTGELPSEAFYLYDPQSGEWYSPTYLPLRDTQAAYSAEFGVDGTATFRMERPEIATELTAFVPPQEPTGVYLLTVTNRRSTSRRLRLAPYFEIALADNPENAGPLRVDYDRASGGTAFRESAQHVPFGAGLRGHVAAGRTAATRRGGFFGRGRSVAHPMFVAEGFSSGPRDRRPAGGRGDGDNLGDPGRRLGDGGRRARAGG